MNEKRRSATDASPDLTVRYGDHLFLAQDSNKINDQHTGQLPLPEYRKDGWKRLLALRTAKLDELKIPFRFLLAPDKQTVYRHLLPTQFRHRTAAHFRDIPNVIDVAPILRTLSPFVDLYPQTDSHWNHLGAYIAAQTVLVSLGLPTNDVDVRWKQWETEGDLGRKLVPPLASKRPLADHPSLSLLAYDNGIGNNGRVRIFCKTQTSQRQSTILIFGDSFSYEMVEFLKESFDVCIQVHSFAVDMALVEALKPNFVVAELTERFSFRLPSPVDANSLATIWIEKLLVGQKPVPIRTRLGRDDMPRHVAKTIDGLHTFGGRLTTMWDARLEAEGDLTEVQYRAVCDIALSSLLAPCASQDTETAERLSVLALRAGCRLGMAEHELPFLALLGGIERSADALNLVMTHLGNDVATYAGRLPDGLRPALARGLVRRGHSGQAARCLLAWLKRQSLTDTTPLDAVALRLLDANHPDGYCRIRQALLARLCTRPDGHRDAYLAAASRLARDGSIEQLTELLDRYVHDIDHDPERFKSREDLLGRCRDVLASRPVADRSNPTGTTRDHILA